MRALVVIPTYNEAASVESVLRSLRQAAPEVDVLVVDDGSPDGTAGRAEKVGVEEGGVHVLRRTAKRGLGPAYLAGFAWGLEHGYRVLVEMDADLSHDPIVVPVLIDALSECDLVIGSRYVPGGAIPNWSLHRKALSKVGNVYSSRMLRLPVSDLTSGFRAYRSELLRDLPLDRISAGGYAFQIEMAYRSARAGARIKEVPIRFVDRTDGESKMSWWITVEALQLVTRWGIGLRRAERRRGRAEGRRGRSG
jgi:dolichol-phosphate mannosyltransferase